MSKIILGKTDKYRQSVIAEFPAISKKMICKGRLNTCKANFQKQRSLKTSKAESILKEKAYEPFWNEQLTEISSGLYLPTKTDYQDSDLISLNGLLRNPMENSWFSTNLTFHQNRSLLKICSPSSMFFLAECTVSEVTKTKLVRLSPTSQQKKIFKHWTDVSRYVFNQTIDYIRSCVNFIPSWMDIKKDLLKILPEWCNDVPFQIKGIAVKEAYQAFFKAKGRPKFRAKKNPEQSCFIPKSAIKETGIYPRISGKGLYFHETLPKCPKDSRLIWRYEKWWLAVPYIEKLQKTENQGSVVALDPGVRSFISFYSHNFSGNIGKGDFSRIQRLCHHLDNLISKRDKCKNKQRRRSLTKASRRMRGKINNLISEIHFKTAKFLTDNFSVILLPTFETKQMSQKSGRKIRKKSVRMMLTFSHFRFKEILKWKALQNNAMVIDCCEAYTSKTHPQTGEVKNIGGAKWIKLKDGSRADRDIVGARNILLRALVDSPTNFVCEVNDC